MHRLSDLLGRITVNDSRTTLRKTTARRSRKVRGAGTALLPLPEDGPQEFPPPAFHAFPYRTALANWPDEWRERWGHRANALEEQGLDWHDAEARAFFEVQHERRAEVGIQPIPLMGAAVERN